MELITISWNRDQEVALGWYIQVIFSFLGIWNYQYGVFIGVWMRSRPLLPDPSVWTEYKIYSTTSNTEWWAVEAEQSICGLMSAMTGGLKGAWVQLHRSLVPDTSLIIYYDQSPDCRSWRGRGSYPAPSVSGSRSVWEAWCLQNISSATPPIKSMHSTLESCCLDMNDPIPWISVYHLIHSEAQVHCMRHLDSIPLGTHTPEETQRVSYFKYENFPPHPSKHRGEEQVLRICRAPWSAIKELPRLLSACLQVGIR